MKRRAWLLSGLGAAGALLVGWGALPPRGRIGQAGLLPARDGEVGLNGWIKIAPDGTVLLAMPRGEMGQGVHTALAQLAAEELDIELDRLRPIPAGADAIYGNVAAWFANLPFAAEDGAPARGTVVRASRWVVAKLARELGISVTAGSTSIVDAWGVLPWAAATARAQLVGAAARRWSLPVHELTVRDGIVHHPSGRRAHFGELARDAAAVPPAEVRLKPRQDWRVIGRALPRIDLPAKVDGSAAFAIDTRLPGQLYSVVRHCPMLGGSPGHIDADAALRLPGVLRVVRLGSYAGSTGGVAVVGRTTWHAARGARALRIDWAPPPGEVADSAAVGQTLERLAREAAVSGGGTVFATRGVPAARQRSAPRRLEAVYRVPYLAHAAMEPMNCTAQVRDGRVAVWVGTQAPSLARAMAARAAGVDEDRVDLHEAALGGGFGRRLEVDVVGQAVRVALETGGQPVQLAWSREEDMRHDFYRPAAVAVLQASLDAQAQLTGLQITSAGDAVAPRWFERALPWPARAAPALDAGVAAGLFDQPYDIEHLHIAHVDTRSGVPVGHWRSAAHSHNAFFLEAFIDELASEARRDPLSFRLALLTDTPRHAAVLRLAAEKAGWGRQAEPGHARGLALHAARGSIVAQVAEVSLKDGRPRVHRVVCAADVGTVVNPDLVAQQLEGGVIFGLSAALHGRIDIEAGVVRQGNFPDYPVLKMADAPTIETHLVASTRAPGGVGEIGTPPIAPAVANALFVLTGKRLRELPLRL